MERGNVEAALHTSGSRADTYGAVWKLMGSAGIQVQTAASCPGKRGSSSCISRTGPTRTARRDDRDHGAAAATSSSKKLTPTGCTSSGQMKVGNGRRPRHRPVRESLGSTGRPRRRAGQACRESERKANERHPHPARKTLLASQIRPAAALAPGDASRHTSPCAAPRRRRRPRPQRSWPASRPAPMSIRARRPWPPSSSAGSRIGRTTTSEQDVDEVRAAIAQAPLRPRRSVPIQKLRAADLQAIYAAMAKDGLADRTRLHLHRVVIDDAQARGPMGRRRSQRRDHGRRPAGEGERARDPPPEQLKAVLASLRSPELRTIADVALGTGLRRGELLALRWQDVELDAAVLRVEQAVEQTKRGGIVIRLPRPATGAARCRWLRPPSRCCASIGGRSRRRGWRSGSARRRSTRFVFANWDGAIRSPHWLTQAWRRAMAAAGLRPRSTACGTPTRPH